MKLKKIHFDLYKSLIDEVMILKDNCTGIVGINESGKTNILNAIRILNKEESLGLNHRPKIKKDSNPKVRFDFELNKELKERIDLILKNWISSNCLVDSNSLNIDFNVQYIVEYDIKKNEEKRSFNIIDYKIDNNDILILKNNFIDDSHCIMVNDTAVPLKEAMIIRTNHANESKMALKELEADVSSIEETIISFNNIISEINNEIKEDSTLAEKKSKDLVKFEEDLEQAKQKKLELDSLFDKVDLTELKDTFNSEIEKLTIESETLEKNIENSIKLINELTLKPDLNPSEKGILTKNINSKSTNEKNLETINKQIQKKKSELNKIITPLEKKYSNDFSNLSEYISKLLSSLLSENLPKVVFWDYSDDYVLGSETEFKDLLSKISLGEISRPLINVFRVGLGINSIDSLKEAINTIQKDSSERGRLEDTFNRNLNKYIKSIWGDYDQKLKIFLEEHKIRIQFFDPETERASYFDMNERSQGAQTFISFLMTIGAEAEKDVINNMILLLDEPEIHLHPSGVRFMLKELVKISKRNNIVIYATHSIFMIDRENYDRHVFLKKKNERTSINLSRKDRIGFFMQEEVLYKAINIDLTKDFNSSNLYNFVFEGDGDVVIFEKYYTLLKNKFPFKKDQTSFYQGGKCSDIKNYFANNPIQLGSTWVFIIDKDNPAKGLKEFIEGKYRDYIDKDIYIYQYDNDDENGDEIELEDLLSNEIIETTYQFTCSELKIEVDVDLIKKNVNGDLNYTDSSKKIMEKLNLNEDEKLNFKALFKENLNTKITELSNNSTTIELFKGNFEVYSSWADKVIDDINSKKLK